MDYIFKPIVLVTGFGPFVNHPVNASWEAVKLMNKEKIEKKHNIELVLIEIPVTYQNVDEFVPALWETHEPKLMIHVGVSHIAKAITLEMQAHRKGYQRQDYFNERPANHVCTAEGAIRLHTKLNVERICKEYNVSSPEKTTAVMSLDAGRFLCEYIYYTSLSHDNTRTLFVHVPDMNIYSPKQTARGLEKILDLCMEQIREGEAANETANVLERANISDNEKSPFKSSTLRTAMLDFPFEINKLNISDTLEDWSISREFASRTKSEDRIAKACENEFGETSKNKMNSKLESKSNSHIDDGTSSSDFHAQLQQALDFRSDLNIPKK